MVDDYEKVREARCDCGQLCLTVLGEPVHVHACACTQCQRSSGSALSYSAWFPASAVTIHGHYSTFELRGPECLDRFRGFCPQCGTGRFFSSGEAFPNTIAISAGAFAQPSFPAPEFILYWADRPEWLSAPVGVVLHEQSDAD